LRGPSSTCTAWPPGLGAPLPPRPSTSPLRLALLLRVQCGEGQRRMRGAAVCSSRARPTRDAWGHARSAWRGQQERGPLTWRHPTTWRRGPPPGPPRPRSRPPRSGSGPCAWPAPAAPPRWRHPPRGPGGSHGGGGVGGCGGWEGSVVDSLPRRRQHTGCCSRMQLLGPAECGGTPPRSSVAAPQGGQGGGRGGGWRCGAPPHLCPGGARPASLPPHEVLHQLRAVAALVGGGAAGGGGGGSGGRKGSGHHSMCGRDEQGAHADACRALCGRCASKAGSWQGAVHGCRHRRSALQPARSRAPERRRLVPLIHLEPPLLLGLARRRRRQTAALPQLGRRAGARRQWRPLAAAAAGRVVQGFKQGTSGRGTPSVLQRRLSRRFAMKKDPLPHHAHPSIPDSARAGAHGRLARHRAARGASADGGF
jgi:hypothetical protein